MAEFQNYFTFSNNVPHLLFKDITVSTSGAMIGLCIGVAVFTFLFEAVKSFRHYLVILQMKKRNTPEPESPEHEVMNPKKNAHSALSKSPSRKDWERLKFHSLQTILHMIQLAMGYMVMLILMSFNAWLLITIILTTALCFHFHEYILSFRAVVVPIEVPGSNL